MIIIHYRSGPVVLLGQLREVEWVDNLCRVLWVSKGWNHMLMSTNIMGVEVS